MQFSDLGLSEFILKAIEEKGYTTPSPIQAQAIPEILNKHDVMAAAQTGTGKTAGFTLPLIEMLQNGKRPSANRTRALILTPTRELAAQIAENIATYSKHSQLKTNLVFGGVKINPQMMALRKGTDILVATPGRLLDLYNQNAIRFEELETLVLDEADRMLFMGFIHDIKKIISLLPKKRQNLMFSATFSGEIRELAKGLMNNPKEISVAPANSTAQSVDQLIYEVDQSKKSKLLIKLIKQQNWQQVLVFSRTKHGANRIARNLESKNITAAPIHGNKSQSARTKALAAFKDKSIRVLVATDIAARGLDIDQLPQVVNFDLPNVAEDYVHRIGRTGRAGSEGKAISFVCADEFDSLNDIEQLIQKHLPRTQDDEIKPAAALPQSKEIKPPKKKKQKKNKPKKAQDSTTTNSESRAAKSSSKTSSHRSGAKKRRSNNNEQKSSNRNTSDQKSSGRKNSGYKTDVQKDKVQKDKVKKDKVKKDKGNGGKRENSKRNNNHGQNNNKNGSFKNRRRSNNKSRNSQSTAA